MLDYNLKENVAIVKHQSMPSIVPLRHVRPRQARSYAVMTACPPTHMLMDGEGRWQDNLHDDMYTTLHGLLDIVDGQAPGTTVTVGIVHDAHGMPIVVPDDFEVNTPEVFRLAAQVGEVLLQLAAPRAIRFGTQLHNICTYHGIKRGVILAWVRRSALLSSTTS